jgi:hypothetical protein
MEIHQNPLFFHENNFFRYRRHYGSKVNRSKQDVIAFVNTVTQFIHRGSYAHIGNYQISN